MSARLRTYLAASKTPLLGAAAVSSWIEISDYVSEIHIQRGRQSERDVAEAGNMTLVLDDENGRFAAPNPLYPFADVGACVKVELDVDGDITPVCVMYADEAPPSPTEKARLATWQFSDGSALLEGARFPIGQTFAGGLTGVGINECVEALGEGESGWARLHHIATVPNYDAGYLCVVHPEGGPDAIGFYYSAESPFNQPANIHVLTIPPVAGPILSDGRFNSFGILDRYTDGELVMVYRRGTWHPTTGGPDPSDIVMRTSVDDGATWTAPLSIASGAGEMLLNCAGGITPTGRLLVFFSRRDAASPFALHWHGYIYSDDRGATWSARIELPHGGETSYADYGALAVAADGDLLQTWYGDSSSYIVRSSDDGATWSVATTILTGGANETSCVHLGGGVLLALSRMDGSTDDSTFAQTISLDDGATWAHQGRATFDSWSRTSPPTLCVYEENGRTMVACYYCNRTTLKILWIKAIAADLITSGVNAWLSSANNIAPGTVEVQYEPAGVPAQTFINTRIQSLCETENGIFFWASDGAPEFRDQNSRLAILGTNQGTFSDDPIASEIGYSDLVLRRSRSTIENDWRITPTGGTEQAAENEASRIAYGRRTITKQLPFAHAADALSVAEHRVVERKDPRTRVESLTCPLGDDATWSACCGLELGDLVTLDRQGAGAPMVFEGLTLDLVGANGVFAPKLSPADSDFYWLLEDDTFGYMGPVEMEYGIW